MTVSACLIWARYLKKAKFAEPINEMQVLSLVKLMLTSLLMAFLLDISILAIITIYIK